MTLYTHVPPSPCTVCLLFHEAFRTERLVFFPALDLFLVLDQSQPVTQSSFQWSTSRGIGELCPLAILVSGKGKSNGLINSKFQNRGSESSVVGPLAQISPRGVG